MYFLIKICFYYIIVHSIIKKDFKIRTAYRALTKKYHYPICFSWLPKLFQLVSFIFYLKKLKLHLRTYITKIVHKYFNLALNFTNEIITFVEFYF